MDAEKLDPFQWQKQRRREGGRFHHPLRGFSESGNLTLWLPSPKTDRRTLFRSGKPVVEVVQAEPLSGEASRLRETILETMSRRGPGLLELDTRFLEFAALVVQENYTCSDDDLTFLFAGDKWHSDMIAYMLGGPGVVDKLAGMSGPVIDSIFPPAYIPSPVIVHPPSPQPPSPAPRPLWRRLLRI